MLPYYGRICVQMKGMPIATTTAALLWASTLRLFASLVHLVGLDQLHWVV